MIVYEKTIYDLGDGPFVDAAGSKRWYKDNKLHRVTAPAYSNVRGYMSWWRENVLHRLKGPAVEEPTNFYADLRQEYYLYGEKARSKSKFLDKSWRRRVMLQQVKDDG
jgi:hypothetical protein